MDVVESGNPAGLDKEAHWPKNRWN